MQSQLSSPRRGYIRSPRAEQLRSPRAEQLRSPRAEQLRSSRAGQLRSPRSQYLREYRALSPSRSSGAAEAPSRLSSSSYIAAAQNASSIEDAYYYLIKALDYYSENISREENYVKDCIASRDSALLVLNQLMVTEHESSSLGVACQQIDDLRKSALALGDEIDCHVGMLREYSSLHQRAEALLDGLRR